jgi:hypothetical protein
MDWWLNTLQDGLSVEAIELGNSRYRNEKSGMRPEGMTKDRGYASLPGNTDLLLIIVQVVILLRVSFGITGRVIFFLR